MINLNEFVLLFVILVVVSLKCLNSNALPSTTRQQTQQQITQHYQKPVQQQSIIQPNIYQQSNQQHQPNTKLVQKNINSNHLNQTRLGKSDSRIIFPTEKTIILSNYTDDHLIGKNKQNSNHTRNLKNIYTTLSSTILSNSSSSSLAATTQSTRDDVPLENSKNIHFIPELGENGRPKCLGDSNFYCEDVNDYPKLDSNDILYQSGELRSLFNFNDEVGLRKSFESSFTDDEQPLCKYEQKIVFPKVAMNKENKWLFVVNDDNEFRQSITSEVCAYRDKSECLNIQHSLPFGTETVCKQKFAYRKLMAIHPDGTMSADVFKFPSCCSCYIKQPLGRSSS